MTNPVIIRTIYVTFNKDPVIFRTSSGIFNQVIFFTNPIILQANAVIFLTDSVVFRTYPLNFVNI